ncbi:MAG TPA: cell division topological specificity factor MinE [Clostridiales bacterium]|nr:cell division topological specificity factor MinE [Clostridiales bacterium]
MGLFNRRRNKKTADIVAQRLVSVLVEDRTGVSHDTMLKIKKEISDVLKKYMDCDPDDMAVEVITRPSAHGARASALVADIPIKRMKKK